MFLHTLCLCTYLCKYPSSLVHYPLPPHTHRHMNSYPTHQNTPISLSGNKHLTCSGGTRCRSLSLPTKYGNPRYRRDSAPHAATVSSARVPLLPEGRCFGFAPSYRIGLAFPYLVGSRDFVFHSAFATNQGSAGMDKIGLATTRSPAHKH